MIFSEQVKVARDLIADPAHWCQGLEARTKDGKSVSVFEPDAVIFCATGALCKATDARMSSEQWALVTEVFGEYAWRFNDKSSHAEVLAKFDQLIIKAQEEEANAI